MELLEHINITIWILQTIAMLITALLLPGLTVSGPFGALIAVIAIAFVNAQLWDAALFFSIPDDLSLHTLTVFLANGVVFWILVKILPGIEVRGIVPALLAPVIFTVTSVFLARYAKDVDWEKVWRKGATNVRAVRDDLKEERRKHAAPEATIP